MKHHLLATLLFTLLAGQSGNAAPPKSYLAADAPIPVYFTCTGDDARGKSFCERFEREVFSKSGLAKLPDVTFPAIVLICTYSGKAGSEAHIYGSCGNQVHQARDRDAVALKPAEQQRDSIWLDGRADDAASREVNTLRLLAGRYLYPPARR